MPAPEVHHLFHHPIADHSFSADRQTLAVARDNNVELYGKSGSQFSLQDELKGHDKTVTGVDIAPETGRIVTCSQDRNAYVWEPSPSGWKPTLVLLRINRAATFVRWSPSERKFAVGSGARVIAVCYFEEENDWWVSKHLKKPIRSTITTVAWHPNSVLLAAGSTDSHARVFSSFIKGVDARPEASVWGERLPFNTVCGEYLNNSAGWVHGCAFSPSGNALAFTSHDSSVTIVYPSGPEQDPKAVVSISTQLLPFLSLIWSGEDEIIAAGYDCEAYRLQGNEGGWQIVGSMESKGRPGMGAAREESALNMFRQMDLKGKAKDDTQLKTVHQNTIATIRTYDEAGGAIKKFSINAQGDPADLSSYPICAQVCGNEANQYPRCERSNLTCVCGPEYRSQTAACEALECSPSEYQKTQLLAGQLCNPTYTNASASSVSVAIAAATANATASAGGKDPTDLSNYPACAQNCITQYLPDSTCGSLSNRACICQGGKGQAQLDKCERAQCSATDLQVLQYFVYELCTPVGGLGNSTNVTLPTQIPPVPTGAIFTGKGVSTFSSGIVWIAFAVVGGMALGL